MHKPAYRALTVYDASHRGHRVDLLLALAAKLTEPPPKTLGDAMAEMEGRGAGRARGGAGMTSRSDQYSLAEVREMSAEQIDAALRMGRLDELLAGRDPGRPAESPPPPPSRADQGAREPFGQTTREDLKGMTPEEIEKARREGRLDHLLGIRS